jgi:hypothetical protein
MKIKDYSVAFGKTKAGKKLGLHLSSCSRTEQFQVASIWGKFSLGVNEILKINHINSELLSIWLSKYKNYIPTANLTKLSKDLLLNILIARYRESLEEIKKKL